MSVWHGRYSGSSGLFTNCSELYENHTSALSLFSDEGTLPLNGSAEAFDVTLSSLIPARSSILSVSVTAGSFVHAANAAVNNIDMEIFFIIIMSVQGPLCVESEVGADVEYLSVGI